MMNTSQGSYVRVEQTSEAERCTRNVQSGVLELRTADVIDYLFGVSTKGPVLTFGLNITKSKKGNLCTNKLCINVLFHAEFKQIFLFLVKDYKFYFKCLI